MPREPTRNRNDLDRPKSTRRMRHESVTMTTFKRTGLFPKNAVEQL
jgi:hypothetical protein